MRADLTKFDSNLDGSAPAVYRQAELCFPSMDALKKGIATPAFKKVADDFKNFADRRAGRSDRRAEVSGCASSFSPHARAGTPTS